MKPKLIIIGAGMGNVELLSQQAKDALIQAKRVLTTLRIGESFKGLNRSVESLSLKEIMLALKENNEDISVLVSGDVGFYSLAKSLIKNVNDQYHITTIAGLSSLQYLSSILNLSYDDTVQLSLHGRSNDPIAAVSYNKKVFFLTGGEQNVNQILTKFIKFGLNHLTVTVGQKLSYADESIVTDLPENLLKFKFDELSVMLIQNSKAVNPYKRLKDRDFIRGQVPMTKEHIRELSVARLEVQPEDIIYDIGAGTGSVTVALAFKANRGMIYAVEKSANGILLIGENRKQLGAYNINVIKGTAPEALEDLPTPNKVFIGGSGKNLSNILEIISEKTKEFIVCINVITLESLFEASKCLEDFGFSDIEISCINCANAEKLGRYNLMKAENPVYIISGRQTGEQ